MLEYIAQNFNWPTFFLSLAVFVLVSNLYNLIIAYLVARKAKGQVRQAEAKLLKLREQLQNKDQELKSLLNQQGDKS